MNRTDWNCCLLPALREESGSQEITEALLLMQERFGFHRFCLTAQYDPDREPVSAFRLRLERTKEQMNAIKPKGMSFLYATSLLLVPDIWEEVQLDRLLYRKKDRILPLQLPIGALHDWIEPEISKLLYKRKYRLWFTSFEYAALYYPTDTIERLSRIKGGIFSFGYKSLCEEKVLKTIKLLLKNNATVLLGSGIDKIGRIWYYEFDAYLDSARRYLGEQYFLKLIWGNQLI